MEINPGLFPSATPPLISGLILLSLGLFTWSKNRRSTSSIYFGLLMLASAVWQVGFAFMNIMSNEQDAFIFSRILYSGVIFIPLLYYGFIASFLGLNRAALLRGMLGLSFIFLFFLWSSRLFLAGNLPFTWGYSSKAAWMHSLFCGYLFIVFISSFREIYQSYKKAKLKDPGKANRIKYVLLAFLVALLGSTDFLSTYGVDNYPLGFFFMISFALITSYAILRHKLLNINLVIKKGFLYSLSFSLISGLLTALLLYTQRYPALQVQNLSFVWAFILVILIFCLFIPLNDFLFRKLGKIIFNASPEELAELNEKLMEQVRQQEQIKAVGIVAAGMAHEIKNPLTAIKTFTEHLPNRANDPDFIQKFYKIVGSEIERIDGIVKQLLEFSKPSPLQISPISLGNVLRETMQLLNAEVIKRRIILELTLPSLRMLSADPKQLKQAFLNLIMNAIQAMPEGGKLSIRISESTEGQTVEISDTGFGIDKNDLPHIFEPFFSTKLSGTGLGLSITSSIVKEHCGTIDVTSTSTGTVFKVKFRNQRIAK
jgi:signal transduction histidine kinase